MAVLNITGKQNADAQTPTEVYPDVAHVDEAVINESVPDADLSEYRSTNLINEPENKNIVANELRALIKQESENLANELFKAHRANSILNENRILRSVLTALCAEHEVTVNYSRISLDSGSILNTELVVKEDSLFNAEMLPQIVANLKSKIDRKIGDANSLRRQMDNLNSQLETNKLKLSTETANLTKIQKLPPPPKLQESPIVLTVSFKIEPNDKVEQWFICRNKKRGLFTSRKLSSVIQFNDEDIAQSVLTELCLAVSEHSIPYIYMYNLESLHHLPLQTNHSVNANKLLNARDHARKFEQENLQNQAETKEKKSKPKKPKYNLMSMMLKKPAKKELK